MEDYGWKKDGTLKPVLAVHESITNTCLELITCACKSSKCSSKRCKCCSKGLPCMAGCACRQDCLNPHNSVNNSSESDTDED